MDSWPNDYARTINNSIGVDFNKITVRPSGSKRKRFKDKQNTKTRVIEVTIIE